jgi:hypothetical protein
MTRRTWLGILSTAMCFTSLPACAPTTQSLLKNDTPKEHGDKFPARQFRDPNDPSEQSEIVPPPRPDQGQRPPGYRVPEYLKPPPVLPPLWLAPTLPVPATQVTNDNPAVTPQVIVRRPEDSDHNLVNALRMLLSKQPDKALPYLEHYDRATQELFIRLLPTLVLLSEKPFDQLSPNEVGALQDQVQGLLVTLRTRSELTINKMCLCDNVGSYGQITPRRDANVFQPLDMMLIYLELGNTSCELRNGYYVTDINGKASITDTAGNVVLFQDFREKEKPLYSASAVHDCCRTYVRYLPAVMPPGKYFLTMEVTDETRPLRRVARKTVEIIVR